jgi:hypothetical protein
MRSDQVTPMASKPYRRVRQNASRVFRPGSGDSGERAAVVGEVFSAADFVTRDQCGQWSPFWHHAYIASNAAIALAYFAIPAVLLAFRARWFGKSRARTWVFCLFAAFIFLCGGGHLVDGVGSFVWPAYRLFAVWHALTAVVSVATACVLPLLFFHYPRGMR